MNAKQTVAVLLAALLAFQTSLSRAQIAMKDLSWYLAHAPFAMPAVAQPSIPQHDFRITDYGANGDGHTLNTEAFRQAIKACAAASGGRVIVPAGKYLTGPIELLSHVELHLEAGALIQFTADHTQYPMLPGRGPVVTSPLYSFDQEDIALTGEGILDGAGDSWRPVKKEKTTPAQWQGLLASGGVLSTDGKIWWPTKEAMNGDAYLQDLRRENEHPTPEDYLAARDWLRPYMVSFANCRRIFIGGVTLRNSPKFVFCPNRCTDLTLDHTHIFNEWWAQNGDGMDISACKNVVIYGCTVSAGDDGICMKSSGPGASAGPDAGSAGPALENVIVAGCTVYRAHGGFVIGSNTDGGMHNIFVSDCRFIGTDVGLRFKSNMGRGGLVDAIFIRNISMQNIVKEAVLFDTYYEDQQAGATHRSEKPVDKTPVFRDFHISNIDCSGAATAISITGLPAMPVSDIYFDTVSIRSTKGLIATQAKNIDCHDVKLDVAERPEFQTDRTAEVHVH
jgi:polygalacturonase